MTVDFRAPHPPIFPDPESLPETLRRLPWVGWKWEPDKDGKPTKVPYSPRTGGKAGSTLPSTWGTLEAALRRGPELGFDGAGFILDLKNRVVGIDLDHCVNPETGEIAPWALAIVRHFASYAEITPSGTGIHILVVGELPPGWRKLAQGIEVYDRARYFTATGHHLPGTPVTVEVRTAELTSWHAELAPPEPETAPAPSGPVRALSLSDQQIIDKAKESRHGHEFAALWDGDTTGHGGDESRADLALVGRLRFWTGGDRQRTDSLFRQSRLMRKKWDERRGDRTYGERTLDRVFAKGGDVYDPGAGVDLTGILAPSSGPTATPPELKRPSPPQLWAQDKNLPHITEAAWKALEAYNATATIFLYGKAISRLERDDEGAPILRDLTEDRLRHVLARAADWYALVADKKDKDAPPQRVAALPPTYVVKDILATPTPQLPVLSRVVAAPVVAPDGSLLTTPGYHRASQTYYAPGRTHEAIPAVAERPSAEDITRAKTLILDELLHDFPFTGPPETAHAVALFLLPFARDLIDGPTPLHLIEKPAAGTGAGLLTEVLMYPAAGRAPAVTTEGRDEDEWRKRLTATLRESPAAIVIDNVRHRIDSASLSAALTAVRFGDRVLGKTETVQFPVRCAWIATGNNPALSDELARRTVRIRMDAGVEQPFLREPKSFRHQDLRGWTAKHRPELIWAALTLIRAWIAEGRKPGKRTLGSYESWARVMGGILDTAEIPGFLGNLADLYEHTNMERASWLEFVDAWWVQQELLREVGKPGATGAMGVKTLLNLVIENEISLDLGSKEGQGQRVRLGIKLAQARGRVFGNKRIEEAGKDKNAVQWKLIPVPSGESKADPTPRLTEDSPAKNPAADLESPPSGESGESFPGVPTFQEENDDKSVRPAVAPQDSPDSPPSGPTRSGVAVSLGAETHRQDSPAKAPLAPQCYTPAHRDADLDWLTHPKATMYTCGVCHPQPGVQP
jgi:hypothetical protein